MSLSSAAVAAYPQLAAGAHPPSAVPAASERRVPSTTPCVDFSMAELLRGGVTTVMEIGTLGEYVVERSPHYAPLAPEIAEFFLALDILILANALSVDRDNAVGSATGQEAGTSPGAPINVVNAVLWINFIVCPP